jgi:serine/threonine-protein phosphatase 2A regulatory subunit B''
MDYKSYLDFVLALENRNSPQGLRYLFNIMDMDKKGYLHAGDLHFFYRVRSPVRHRSRSINVSIQGMLEMLEKRPETEMPSFNNLQNEIFDMVKPVDSMRIKLKDLIDWSVTMTCFVHLCAIRMTLHL